MATQGRPSWPLPDVANVDKPFWDAAQDETFLLQKCRECGRLQFLPRPICVDCFSMDLDWKGSKGTGEIYSFTPVFVPVRPAPRIQVKETGVPIIFAAIDLDEGVRALSEIVDCEPEEVKIGDRVQVCFREAAGTDFKMPKFRLVK